MRERPESPAITEEDIKAMMTAQPGEQFLRVTAELEDAFPREN
jgi:hypothetical protein